MDALLVITLVCFFALFVTALAIARHIQIVGQQGNSIPHNSWLGSTLSQRRAILPISQHPTDQRLHKLIEHKEPDWRYLISGDRRSVFSKKKMSPATRKPPESTRLSLRERPQWTYSDQDRPRLSDPYTRSH